VYSVLALYKFIDLPDYQSLQEPLRAECERLGIRGSLLIAPEGINGTVSGTARSIDALLSYFGSDARFSGLEAKISLHETQPFLRLKIKLKKEIVTMGVPWVDPRSAVGTYVEPRAWNALIDDPGVTVIDTRNDYEVRVGSFRGAIDPGTEKFRDFPQWVSDNLDPVTHPRVAMFCTGGIRCEKATSFLLQKGFQEVYHLKGGVLKYLEQVPEHDSRWQGECFVFDDRVAVTHGLQRGSHVSCHACGQPLSPTEQASPDYVVELSCPYCITLHGDEKRRRLAQRKQQIERAGRHNEKHVGRNPRQRS
jgi:UPF0176 protein